MNIMDCHLHSSLSFDSKEDMENYIKIAHKNGDKYFITTEHMDLESNLGGGMDLHADFAKQEQTIRSMAEKYDMIVLYGIEVGWRQDINRRNLQVVQAHPFDMVILAVHENEKGGQAFSTLSEAADVDTAYAHYLDLCYNAVSTFQDYDTFAHLDYMLRYIGHTDLRKHREKIEKIFKVLIEKDKALEINSKLVPSLIAMERIEFIISTYTALGGKKVTLGSDGHTVAYYKNGFRDAMKLLDKYGITELSQFIGRKEVKVPISLKGGKFI